MAEKEGDEMSYRMPNRSEAYYQKKQESNVLKSRTLERKESLLTTLTTEVLNPISKSLLKFAKSEHENWKRAFRSQPLRSLGPHKGSLKGESLRYPWMDGPDSVLRMEVRRLEMLSEVENEAHIDEWMALLNMRAIAAAKTLPPPSDITDNSHPAVENSTFSNLTGYTSSRGPNSSTSEPVSEKITEPVSIPLSLSLKEGHGVDPYEDTATPSGHATKLRCRSKLVAVHMVPGPRVSKSNQDAIDGNKSECFDPQLGDFKSFATPMPVENHTLIPTDFVLSSSQNKASEYNNIQNANLKRNTKHCHTHGIKEIRSSAKVSKRVDLPKCTSESPSIISKKAGSRRDNSCQHSLQEKLQPGNQNQTITLIRGPSSKIPIYARFPNRMLCQGKQNDEAHVPRAILVQRPVLDELEHFRGPEASQPSEHKSLISFL